MSIPASARAAPALDRLQPLRDAGAPQLDAVRWHYIETLAARMGTQPPKVQWLLQDKLAKALDEMQQRLAIGAARGLELGRQSPPPSPLASLVQEMAPVAGSVTPVTAIGQPGESPRVRQFRKQLRKISVQKQVSRAMAQAPQNAGPINSHMLVIRALGLMRDISPDYLNRFMSHVDTLLCLEDAERQRLAPRKAAKPGKPRGKP